MPLLKHTNYMNRIGQYADIVKVAEMFRNGLYAENSSNLDRYSLHHRRYL